MDLSKLSIEGQTLKSMLTKEQEKAARRIQIDLEGMTVSEAAMILDYVREAINCSEVR